MSGFIYLMVFGCIIAYNTAVTVVDVTFKKTKELSTILPLTPFSYLFKNDNTKHSCFEYCIQNENCLVVIVIGASCYASDYPTSMTYSYKGSSQSDVYIKTPNQVCVHSQYIFYKGMCVKRSTDKLNWHDAKTHCKQDGGQLIVMDSTSKHLLTLDFLDNTYAIGNDQYFIGASDLKNEGDWRWNMKDASSSFPFSSFNNNDSGYPGKESDCGCLKMSPRQVVDEYCGQKKMFLCEI